MANALCPSIDLHPPQDLHHAILIIDTAFRTAAYSARAAIHSILKISPAAAALVIHRNMIFDIPIIPDLQLIQHQRLLELID